MTRWRNLIDRVDGKAPTGARRSGRWRKVRDEFLKGKTCAGCGRRDHLTAHHVIPFHLDPAGELDPDNLLPLCERGRYGIGNCHQLIGHLGNWRRFNPAAAATADFIRKTLSNG